MGVAAPAIGLGMTAAQGVNSGIKGKQAANQADQLGQQQIGMGEQLFDMGMGQSRQIQGAYDQFNNPGLGQQVTDLARQAGGDISQIAGGAASGLGALQGQIPGGQIAGPNAQNFDFYQAQGVNPDQLSAVMQNAQQFGDRARAGALEQAGQAFASGGDALNAALADRGMGAGSGVAAGALGQLAAQGAQSQSQLNRQLADQAGQQGLQAGQFDIQNRLASEGLLGQQNLGQQQLLGNYNLGLNQLGQQAQQSTFQNQLAGIGQQAGLIGQQAQLGMQGAMAPYELMQGAYSQNYLNPGMAALGMMNPGQYLQAGLGTVGDAANRSTQGAASAGAGKGSAKGAMPGILQSFNGPSAPAANGGGGGYIPQFGAVPRYDLG